MITMNVLAPTQKKRTQFGNTAQPPSGFHIASASDLRAITSPAQVGDTGIDPNVTIKLMIQRMYDETKKQLLEFSQTARNGVALTDIAAMLSNFSNTLRNCIVMADFYKIDLEPPAQQQTPN